ncbi:hypothetical protein Rsw2DRAFT_1092 [Rhodobacter ferrooxidans]|uniref:Uncharacterized protein n=1 Tax=Rhodobacter ferrooxidans TaxID=371731 RepID=C8RZ64_9RHOB|nr:hypothetical protein Rsw2DRAFT_1092 [Rhodobacter sp. SW2]
MPLTIDARLSHEWPADSTKFLQFTNHILYEWITMLDRAIFSFPRVTSHQRGLSLTIRDLGRFVTGSCTQRGTATDTLGNSYKLLF